VEKEIKEEEEEEEEIMHTYFSASDLLP